MKLLQHTYILISLVAVVSVLQLAKISGAKDISPPITASEKTSVVIDTSLADASPAANYTESDNSWSFSAQVLEIKDVSIYGRPGSIAKIEYVHRGEAREAWAVLKIDNYFFSESRSDITVGDQITLRVSGDYVSPKGVDWNSCPASDEFCQHADFIEGGFPTSEDYGGLTISPSNTLIYSGSVDDDWINGMLAWRIISSED
jgi:hypothetical protein